MPRAREHAHTHMRHAQSLLHARTFPFPYCAYMLHCCLCVRSLDCIHTHKHVPCAIPFSFSAPRKRAPALRVCKPWRICVCMFPFCLPASRTRHSFPFMHHALPLFLFAFCACLRWCLSRLARTARIHPHASCTTGTLFPLSCACMFSYARPALCTWHAFLHAPCTLSSLADFARMLRCLPRLARAAHSHAHAQCTASIFLFLSCMHVFLYARPASCTWHAFFTCAMHCFSSLATFARMLRCLLRLARAAHSHAHAQCTASIPFPFLCLHISLCPSCFCTRHAFLYALRTASPCLWLFSARMVGCPSRLWRAARTHTHMRCASSIFLLAHPCLHCFYVCRASGTRHACYFASSTASTHLWPACMFLFECALCFTARVRFDMRHAPPAFSLAFRLFRMFSSASLRLWRGTLHSCIFLCLRSLIRHLCACIP